MSFSELFQLKEVLGLIVGVTLLVDLELTGLFKIDQVSLIVQQTTLLVPKHSLGALFPLHWGCGRSDLEA